jgi:hypothetical protein
MPSDSLVALLGNGSSSTEPPPPSARLEIENPPARKWLELEPTFMFHVAVSQTFVGEVTGGYRIDLHFEDGAAEGKPSGNWSIPAKLLSGNDWVAVTSEGVMDFDSRFTIEFSEQREDDAERPPARVPVGARLRGRASVRDTRRNDDEPVFPERDSINSVMNAWQRGIDDDAYLPLRLTVTLDIPREGFSQAETALYDQLRPLGQFLFIGCGRAFFDGSPYGSVDRIELGVYRMIGDPRMSP